MPVIRVLPLGEAFGTLSIRYSTALVGHMTAEFLPRSLDAEHLTEALRRSGVPGVGHVREVTVENSHATLLSRIVRLRLTYRQADAAAPSSLIFKTGLPERADVSWEGGRQEVAFYTQVAAAMAGRTVPRCYEAHWDPDSRAWHLLLEDLTDSHVIATIWPLPPTIEQCKTILDARARFHAEWWDDSRLGRSIGTWSDAEAFEARRHLFAEKFARFADRAGDLLPRGRRDVFERFLDAAPRLRARYDSHRNLTIVHGDAHVWNCFLPRDGCKDDARLFDWDSWRLETASLDLAYMMAMHWYPGRRRQMERPLLDFYHTALLAHGVRGYDRRALEDDYRLSVLWLITIPVWQEAYNIPPMIWWNNLERILLAFDDLGCRELLV